MAKKPENVVIIKNAMIDVLGDDLVIRGYVEKSTIQYLQVDEYQREQRSEVKLMDMVSTLVGGGRLPDVVLNIRSQNYREVSKGTYHFYDDVWIVDGQQRTAAAVIACKEHLGLNIHHGVLINIGKSREWEKEEFERLNLKRDAVKKSVLLRNRKEQHPVIASLFGLTKNEKTFPLYNKVTWTQDAHRGDIINAWTLARYACILHSHKVPVAGPSFEEVVDALDRAQTEFGLQMVRANVRNLFDAIEQVWGISNIKYKQGAIHMRKNSLTMLVRVVANHHNFWRQPDERELVIDADMRCRFQNFKFSEPFVRDVLSREASRMKELTDVFVEAVNKRRSKKLRPRKVEHIPVDRDIDEDEVDEAA